MPFTVSPSSKVDQFSVQRGNEDRRYDSPSDLHGNFVGLLHSGKSADLLHIHRTHCGHYSHPLACQKGPSSPLIQTPVGMDPTRMNTFYDFTCQLNLFFFPPISAFHFIDVFKLKLTSPWQPVG